MLCYRDMTFCNHYTDCSKKDTCDRPFTPQVKKDAEKWWGDDGAPIAMFVDKPECWEEASGH